MLTNCLGLTVDIDVGTSIDEAAEALVALANKFDLKVNAKFNGIELHAYPSFTKPEKIISDYNKIRKMKLDHYGYDKQMNRNA